jgi:hypothetical protein
MRYKKSNFSVSHFNFEKNTNQRINMSHFMEFSYEKRAKKLSKKIHIDHKMCDEKFGDKLN